MTAGALCSAAEFIEAAEAAASALRGRAIVPHNARSVDRIEQLLKDAVRREQAARPVPKNITDGELRGGIIQDNSPAITWDDQTDLVLTGPTPIPNQASTAEEAGHPRISLPIPQDHGARGHENSIVQVPPEIVVPYDPGIPSGPGTEHMQDFFDRAERAERAVHAQPGMPNAARYFAAQAQEAARLQQPQFVYEFKEPAWADQVQDFEMAGLDSAVQKWARSRGLHSSLDQIHAKLVDRHRAAQSQANNNGDSEDGSATTAAPSMAGGPGLKPPADDEDEEEATEPFTKFAEGRLQKHFNEHVNKKAEWGPTVLTEQEYLKKAQDLLRAPIRGDIEGFTSKNGWTFRYNRATNEFATGKPNGIIETLFRPTDGIVYWIDQILKYKYRV